MSKFNIKPGQFMILRFLTKDRWYEGHPFSLSWVPKKNSLRITPKHVGDFTKKISTVPKGSPVLIDGPYGVFTADTSVTGQFLFIAGGIGITPIRALLEQTARDKKDIVLLYTCSTQDDLVFKKELDELAKIYNFSIHYILTQDPNYKGETGRINAEKIQRLVKDFKERDAYICGPMPMIDSVRNILIMLGVPKKQIHFEKFSMV